MPSNRIGRINEEIQRELADQLRRLKDPRVSQVGMVSITRVDTTSDLRYARVYISVLDKDQEKDVLKGLKSAGGYLRRELGHVVTSFAYYFNIVVYHTGSSAGKFDFTPFAGNRNKSCIHASNRL